MFSFTLSSIRLRLAQPSQRRASLWLRIINLLFLAILSFFQCVRFPILPRRSTTQLSNVLKARRTFQDVLLSLQELLFSSLCSLPLPSLLVLQMSHLWSRRARRRPSRSTQTSALLSQLLPSATVELEFGVFRFMFLILCCGLKVFSKWQNFLNQKVSFLVFLEFWNSREG